MKKILSFLFIGVGVILLFGIGMYFWQQKLTRLEFTQLEDLVSDDAIGYIATDNLNDVFTKLEQTALVKNIAKSTFWSNFVDSDKVKTEYEKALKVKDIVLSVLKKGYSVALFSREKAEVNFLHLVELTPESKFKEKILKIFLDKSKKADVESSKYKKFVISTVHLDNSTIYYTVAGNIALISDNQQLLTESLDLGCNVNKDSLSDNPRVNNAKKLLNKTGRFMWVWFDVNKWQEVSYQALEKQNEDAVLDEQSINEFKSPFSDVCFEVVFDKGFDIRTVSVIDKALGEDNKQIQAYSLFSGKASDKRFLNLYPQQSLAIASIHIDDFLKWYDSFKGYLEVPLFSAPGANNTDNFKLSVIKKKLMDYCGIDLEQEIIANIGKELSLGFVGFENLAISSLNKMSGKAGFSLPLLQLLLAFEVKDKVMVKATIEKLYNKVIADRNDKIIAQLDIPEAEESQEVLSKLPKFELQQRDYKGDTVYQIGIDSPELQDNPLLLGLTMMPSFSIKNSDLLVSFPPESVNRALDNHQSNEDSIRANEKISDLLNADYNFMFFVDVDGIISSLEFLLKMLPLHESISDIIDIVNSIDFIASRMFNGSEFAESNFILELK